MDSKKLSRWNEGGFYVLNINKMKVLVPTSVDVKGLLGKMNLTPTRFKNLKNKTHYLLSCIVVHNDNYNLFEESNGYRIICSSQMKKIIGNNDYYLIRDMLMDKTDPIIESNESWYNPAVEGKKGYCLGYRLSEKYNTGEVEYKTLPDKMNRFNEPEFGNTESNEKYQYLLNQFEKHKISFDPRVYDYVRNFGNQLFARIENNNPYQTKLVYNTIGRWLDRIQKIEDRKTWKQVSPKNHRLNSSITSLPKLLRPFLLCNGEPLIDFDVSSSQPYILLSIMNDWFFKGTGTGYNLKTIYPELFDEMTSIGMIDSNISTYSSSTSNNYISTISNSNNNYEYSTLSSYSFMWCKFSTQGELESINHFKNTPFYNDFYTYVLRSYYQKTGVRPPVDISLQRDEFKKSMMFVLFEGNNKHRNHNHNIKVFRTVFPGVDKWITEFHKRVGTAKFSYLLQRTESYLLLDKICREFHFKNPDAPLFTIHDGILTHQKYVSGLTGFVLRRLEQITGVSAGFKIKIPQINPEPRIEDIDKVWGKINGINTPEKYNKVQSFVFQNNVERGIELLEISAQKFL